MVLSGAVIEFCYYGVLGAYFTHSWLFPIAVVSLFWFFNILVAVHRNDPFRESTSTSDLIIKLDFATPLSLLFGTALGLAIVWAFQLPPLLDPEFWHVRRSLTEERAQPIWIFDFSVGRFVIGAVVAAAGVDLLLGDFQPELTALGSVVLGVLALIIGLGLAVYSLFRWYTSPYASDWLTLGFIFALMFYAAVPAVYDFLLFIRPNQGWLLQLALALVTLGVVLISVRYFTLMSMDQRAALRSDVRYSNTGTTPRQLWTRWLVLYIPLALIYLVGWIRDEQTQHVVVGGAAPTIGDIEQVQLIVALTTVILFMIFMVLGLFRWRSILVTVDLHDDIEANTRPVVSTAPARRPEPAPAATSQPVQSQGTHQRPAATSNSLDAHRIKPRKL